MAEASDTPSASADQRKTALPLGRRSLFSLAAATTLPHSHAASPAHDQHLVWLREYFRLRRHYNETPVPAEEEDAAFDEFEHYWDLVMNTPAQTIEACLAQMILLVDGSIYVSYDLEIIRPPLLATLAKLRIDTWSQP